jgi:hypothetical protein
MIIINAMLDRSSHAFSERLFGYEGAAWGPRYTTENFLQRLRGNAASAIAAPAKIWFVPQSRHWGLLQRMAAESPK